MPGEKLLPQWNAFMSKTQHRETLGLYQPTQQSSLFISMVTSLHHSFVNVTHQASQYQNNNGQLYCSYQGSRGYQSYQGSRGQAPEILNFVDNYERVVRSKKQHCLSSVLLKVKCDLIHGPVLNPMPLVITFQHLQTLEVKT